MAKFENDVNQYGYLTPQDTRLIIDRLRMM